MLIDTSGFLSLIHKDEREHADAVEIYGAGASYVTHIMCSTNSFR